MSDEPSVERGTQFECPHCDATFNQATYRRQHIKKAHRIKRKRRRD